MSLRFSLKYRIAATILVLEALLVGAVLWQTLTLSADASRKQQAAHEEVTLSPLTEIGRIALLTEEYTDVQAYIQKVKNNQDVTHLILADNRGRVMASTAVSDMGSPMPPLQDTGERYWRIREIQNANGKLGVLAVEFSQAEMTAAKRRALNFGITLALVGMAFIAIVGIIMGHLLTRRLDVLAKTAQHFAGGDLHAVAGIEGNDEVAEVGRAFDRMASKIRGQIEEIKDSRESFALAVSGTNDGIWDWNLVSDTAQFSPRLKAMLGFSEDDPGIGNNIREWKDRIHPDDKEHTLRMLEEYLAGHGEFFVGEHRLRKKSGEYLWGLVRGKAQRDATGRVARMAGSLTDITERKLQEEAMQHQALHDALTGLPNRNLFRDRLEVAMRVTDRESKPFSILMMDLDRFKEINDTLGHHIGDEVLQEVALRLEKVLRASDTVSRFGGDEFVMLLPGTSVDQAVRVITKIRSAFEVGFVVEGHALNIEASIGVTAYPEHGNDAHTLIKRADVAMYSAKNNGTGYAVYDVKTDSHSPNRLSLIGELRRGIERGELLLHYQPKISLKTGAVYGVEALVRWQHPDRGMIPPVEFISLAEGCGLINPLTEWVLDTALCRHYRWRLAGVELITGVNLSMRNLQDLDFPNRVAANLKAWEIEPQWLELEITESVIMNDPIRALQILSRLDEMGVRLAIDDFGTGYSSLAYLKRLPVDEVKIDRSFVMDMLHDESNSVIVQSTIDLGHNLGLKVVAEGVENVECLNLLRSLGCDAAQGYYISRPLEADAFVKWLVQWSAHLPARESAS